MDGRLSDIRWDSFDGEYEGKHGYAGDCFWSRLNHPELCDSCLREFNLDTSGNSNNDSVSISGVRYSCQSMEGEITMESFLGTIWFVCLVGCLAFGAGMWMKDFIMDKLGR